MSSDMKKMDWIMDTIQPWLNRIPVSNRAKAKRRLIRFLKGKLGDYSKEKIHNVLDEESDEQ